MCSDCDTAITIFYIEIKAFLILVSFTRVKATKLAETSLWTSWFLTY